MPFGLPVVPDEYSRAPPSHSSAIGSGGYSATAFSYESHPSMTPSTISRCSTRGVASGFIATTTSPSRLLDRNTRASQSLTMYSTSGAVRCELTVVQYKPERCAAQAISMNHSLFSMKMATASPGARPRARNSCARRFERSSSSRYVMTSPVAPMIARGGRESVVRLRRDTRPEFAAYSLRGAQPEGGAVNLELTEDQEFFRETTRRFLDSEAPLTSVRALWDTTDGLERDWWSKAAGLGWTTLFVPEAHGGGSLSGHPVQDAVIVAEEMGRIAAPGPFLPVNVVCAAVARAGERRAAGRAVPGLLAGETIATWAFAERGGTWDASGVSLTADARRRRDRAERREGLRRGGGRGRPLPRDRPYR